jgi:glucosyl-dolichyl phosphate glucuronosyltransferase
MSNNHEKSVSVVICAYTEDRWQDLLDAVASLCHQTVLPCEIIVVIDDNSSLFARSSVHFHDLPGAQIITVVENREQSGLSGARNTGIAIATGAIIAFLDDDAMAAHDWIEQLIRGFAGPAVMGVGGAIVPLWDSGRPGWFPKEFDWVVGCTYRGMPDESAPIRNLIGANMSFRREVFDTLGGFRNGVGQVGNSMLRCDDTEFCIRVGQRWPTRQMLYLPAALVYHHVPASRARWSYFRRRCYTEGLAKALVANLVGTQDGLSSEWHYTLQTLPTGLLNGVRTTVRTADMRGVGQAFAITAGLALTTIGYLVGRLSTWQRAAPMATQSPTLVMEKSAL